MEKKCGTLGLWLVEADRWHLSPSVSCWNANPGLRSGLRAVFFFVFNRVCFLYLGMDWSECYAIKANSKFS